MPHGVWSKALFINKKMTGFNLRNFGDPIGFETWERRNTIGNYLSGIHGFIASRTNFELHAFRGNFLEITWIGEKLPSGI